MSSLPQPSVALDNICSAIWNNTLYTYSANAFQSLSLTPGAEWQTLAFGESVTGGVCVGSTPADASQAGFFVVGGKGTTAGYTGLQKYTYATGQWATLTPESLVTQDRLYHGAVYINATDSIFMYAGAQDGSTSASQQTFTIQASAPYAVAAYASTAPPTTNPILLQWSASEAVMVGGSTSNKEVMLFDPVNGGWINSGTTLLDAIPASTASIQAALIIGDDNSKNLYTFNAAVSPNQVSRIVLMDGSGTPVTNSGPTKRSLPELQERGWGAEDLSRRALTLSDWPAYNASLAPTTTRSGFSIAQGNAGMVVLAGGGGSDVLCIFNGRTNAWRNATNMLSQKEVVLETASSSSSSAVSTKTATPTTLLTAPSSSASTTAATVSPTASETAAAAAATSSGMSTNTILGITLGSLAGVGIILLALYLLLRRRKRRDHVEMAHNRCESGHSEKDAFAMTGDSLSPRPMGKGIFRSGHQPEDSKGSFASVAILMGRVNQPRTQDNVPLSGGGKRSSASSLFNKGFKGTISRPIPQSEPNMAQAASPRRLHFDRGGSSGIGAGAAAASTSAYGRSVTDPKQQQARRSQQPQQNGNLQREDSTRRSSGWNRYWSGGSALNILGFGSGNSNNGAGANSRNSKRTTVVSDVSSSYSTVDPNYRITQDSATVPPLDIPGMPDAKPRFQRVNSGSPTIANFDSYLKDGMQGKIERSNSQASSHSGYSSGVPTSVHDMWDPTSSSDKPWGADRAPSSAYSSNGNNGPLSSSGGKKSYVPTSMSRQPQLAMANTSSDMSWLNLGDVSSRV